VVRKQKTGNESSKIYSQLSILFPYLEKKKTNKEKF
jgi:hypothetical protein